MKTLELNKKTLERLASKEMQDLVGGRRDAMDNFEDKTDSTRTQFTKIRECC